MALISKKLDQMALSELKVAEPCTRPMTGLTFDTILVFKDQEFCILQEKKEGLRRLYPKHIES